MKHYRPFCFTQRIKIRSNNQTNQSLAPRRHRKLLLHAIVVIALTITGVPAGTKLAAAQSYFMPVSPDAPDGVKKDMAAFNQNHYAEALLWFQPAADEGIPVAQYVLGFMYQQGLGVQQDYSTAIKWYNAAANQGQADAEEKLGILFQRGMGVAKDDTQAAAWYRKAADHGQPDAQALLGMAYVIGAGVPKDYPEAMRLFRKAAAQGSVEGTMYVGQMYRDGLGVQKNYFEALAWYRKAADKGYKTAQERLDELEEHIHEIIPPSVQIRCALEGAPPVWKASEARVAMKRYDDCVERFYKKLGSWLR